MSSKKQIVLELFAGRSGRQLEVSDLRAARTELQSRLGADDRTSVGYIASVLRAAGYDVRYEDPYADPVMPEPYATTLKGVLEFGDLTSAEQSLQRLDALYRDYTESGDRQGVKFVWTLVKKGKVRAQRLATSPRVRESKRREKAEIARWFQVWLETPDLFSDWLALRKSSAEFRQFFPPDAATDD